MISFAKTQSNEYTIHSIELDLFISVCNKIFSTLLYKSEQYENVIQKCIEVDLSNVETVNCLSTHNIQTLIDEHLFSKAITEDLKYILINRKTDIQNEREKIAQFLEE